MASKLVITFAICLCVASSAAAQVVRFETTVGNFDMVLNPTNNPRLQGHVDNMVQYVENGNYSSSWVNRAVSGFILQMGSLYSHTKRPPLTIESTSSVATFESVTGEPPSPPGGTPLHTVGTVSLALRPAGGNRSDPNSGTSSFFINVGDNPSLNLDFTVFAAIPDMTVINQIMALPATDLTDPTREPEFGAGGLTFSDVPVMDNGHQVFIKRAFVVDDAMTIARAVGGIQSILAQSTASFGSGDGGGGGFASAVVPEPTGAAMLLVGQLFLLGFRRRRPTV